jgi:molybdopterin molybdotransferase
MLPVADALRLLLEAAAPLDAIDAPLDGALGRILAEDVAADRDAPPTDRSAMDGFAVRASDVSGERAMLRVIGELPAGRPAEGLRVGAGEAVRIFTGGVMPEGADAVVMVEVTEESADRSTVVVLERPTPGQHVRRRGEDLVSGSKVLAAGARIDAAAAAALSAVGATRVSRDPPAPCRRRLHRNRDRGRR